MTKLDGHVRRVQQSLLLTSEILENHGYNVINVEEGNHGEIKKRNKCFSALREFMTTLTETQAGGGQSGTQVAASGWKKVLKFGECLATGTSQRTSSRVGHNSGSNCASTEGQQVWS